MDDTNRPGQRGLLVLLGVVALFVVLIVVSGSPARFLNWVFSILAAFSLLLLFAFVFALVLVVVAAVLRRYVERRRQEPDDEPRDRQSPQPRMRGAQYFHRRQRHHRPADEWEDRDY
ncbi:MAG: hypothetical protein E6J33_01765 [Chloroflexi bacterium]|nr:MAG: hypothetical protein E6J33_01765 [Chloroflexota bacterium]